MKPGCFTLLLSVVLATTSAAFSQSTEKKEIDVGFASIDLVRPILQGALSPVGKFVMLPNKGSVMVIDTPSGILAAEQALAGAALPEVDVALDFEFVTGLPARRTQITVAREVPLPYEYAPPTIFVGPNGNYTVIPATPTRFERRNIGVTSETVTSVNPDGSINLDINTESTEFEGFINYGSAILPAGGVGMVPIGGPVSNPLFFEPFINSGNLNLPIISTTRISTSVVIRPRVNLGTIELDVLPRFTVVPESDPAGQSPRKPMEVDLQNYQTVIVVPNGKVGRVYGFTGASEEFNRQFLGAGEPREGSAAIEVRATIKPAGTAASATTAPVPTVEVSEPEAGFSISQEPSKPLKEGEAVDPNSPSELR
ncbi:MAG: hypothetical protein AAGA96_20465 [Verrucomicrobiota bacterium]